MSEKSLTEGGMASSSVRQPSAVWGYVAGIVTGVTYGLNPLFAVPLMRRGISVDEILFFRYLLAVAVLGGWLAVRGESFRVSRRQAIRLLILGILFALSSLTLFEAYRYIPSGVATTIVFLYPVLVAVIMVFMRVYPTWQVWLSIVMTFVGVLFLCRSDGEAMLQWRGLALSFGSALAYAMFIVIVNRSRVIRTVSNSLLTFYALLTGSALFLIHSLVGAAEMSWSGAAVSDILFRGLDDISVWGSLMGLAVMPTVVSTATLAMATRIIGATKASVLGVFEPVTAILVGALAFGERITANVVTGILLTMAAITFMIVSSSKGNRIK